MNEENKSTNSLIPSTRVSRNRNKSLTPAEKLAIFEDYLTGKMPVGLISAKYGRGITTISTIISTFAAELAARPEVARPEVASAAGAADADPSSNKDIFMGKERELKLAQQVKELQTMLKQQEKQLEHERLGHLFYKTMVDIAEKELHLDIRKKYGAKQ